MSISSVRVCNIYLEEQTNLLIPWLLVGFVRCIVVNLVSLVTGSYICLIQKGHHTICLDFLLAQLIQHGPSVYAWFSVLSYYKDLQLYWKDKEKRRVIERGLACRRKKARRMEGTNVGQETVDGTINFSSESTLGSGYYEGNDTLTSSSRSLDTLLKLRSNERLSGEMDSFESMQMDENNSNCESGKELLNAVDQAVSEDSNRDIVNTPEIIVAAVANIESGKGVYKSPNTSLHTHEATITDIMQQATTSGIGNNSCTCLEHPLTQNSILNKTEPNSASSEKTNCSRKPKLPSSKCAETKKKCATEKKDFLGDKEEVVKIENFMEFVLKIQKGINFGCQVNTLSKSLLNLPPEEVSRKYNLSKKFFIDHISIK